MEEFLSVLGSCLELEKVNQLLKVLFGRNSTALYRHACNEGCDSAIIPGGNFFGSHNCQRAVWVSSLTSLQLKKLLEENNSVTNYTHFCHCHLFLSSLYFEAVLMHGQQ